MSGKMPFRAESGELIQMEEFTTRPTLSENTASSEMRQPVERQKNPNKSSHNPMFQLTKQAQTTYQPVSN